MTARYFLLFLTLLFSVKTISQNFAGHWQGELTQDGKPGIFVYQIDLVQHEGRGVSGTAISRKKEGGTDAKFEIGGAWDGETLTLQEVKQTEPPGARWCLKHIRLKYDGDATLQGNWEAEGCTPGWLRLSRQSPTPNPNSEISNPQPPLPGHWAGTLSQSDRDYGFFFELDLNADGTGTSTITSDGEGGNAVHSLRWSWGGADNSLVFNEIKVDERSVDAWPWCIKSAKLVFEKQTNRLSLTGDWNGHIEGYTAATGACAPGKLYLERPVFNDGELVGRRQEVALREGLPAANTTPALVEKYEQDEARKVSVDRVLEVQNKTVKVAVWDNGIVDGDIVSLFVNGEKILENYRVSRRKQVTIVKLDKPTNYLILHAINLGSITPNTVAVSVDDGVQEQVVIMSSNLRESGAVMLREFRVE